MKKVPLLLSALLLLAAVASSQTLSQADKDKGLQYLQQTRDGLVAATKDLSDEQLKFKPGPDRWSISEVLEHIALGEDFIFQNITNNIMKAPAGPADRDTAKIDAMILAALPDRSQKKQAPGPLVPTGRWTAAESLDHFLKSRAATVAYLQSTPDLRAHVSADNPFKQPFDGYDWILFLAGHSERHTKQILEVKADPNFPKS